MSQLTRSPAWQALAAHQKKIAATTLAAFFAADSSRAKRFTAEAGGILLDYSKHRVDAEALRLLLALAAQAQLSQWIARMFAGEPINNTEGRPALHVALRAHHPGVEVRDTLERMRRFVGEVRGDSRITDVVNIGIGGSDLGPRMLTRALRRFRTSGPGLHFVSNIDPADLDATLAGLSAATTLFIVASKTFSTAETLDNAARAKAWLEAGLGKSADLSRHFAAATANV
ncbi:MAG TPA: glucose-6-phosphate isomerase, partial [Burkholderiales bacterium]|nr:glucose-6-phosphate isomerase [Burkholderiales bacterium]